MRSERCVGPERSHVWRPKKVKGQPWNPRCIQCNRTRKEVGYGKSNPRHCPRCGCDLEKYTPAELRKVIDLGANQ
jgi:hypothetical protein